MELIALPHWEVTQQGEHSGRLDHEGGTFRIKIAPLYRSSTHTKRGETQEPQSYRVKLDQDWFSKGTVGDQSIATKAATREEAEEFAHQFMEEFNERRYGPIEKQEEKMEEVVGDEVAEDLAATQAAAGAITDIQGYTDETFLEILDEALGDTLRVVAHRAAKDVDFVYTRDDVTVDDEQIHEYLGLFAVDKRAVEAVFDTSGIDYYTIELDDLRIIRFITGPGTETVISTDVDAPITSPAFENTVAEVLEERHTG